MTEEPEVAPQEATEEVVTEAPEAEEAQAEGQTDEQTEASEDADDEPKRKSRHQRRREQIERARQEADDAKAQVKELEARLAEAERVKNASKLPSQDDYSTYEEYQAALSGYHALQQMDAREIARIQAEHNAQRQAAQAAESAQQSEVQQSWASNVEEAKQRYTDFDRVVTNNQSVPIPQHVAEVIMQMDGGPDVAYHLGTNVNEAARIASLPPVLAAMELGKIEATLSRPKPQTVTQAPDPISPVKPKASVAKSPEKMSHSEFVKWREGGGTL